MDDPCLRLVGQNGERNKHAANRCYVGTEEDDGDDDDDDDGSDDADDCDSKQNDVFVVCPSGDDTNQNRGRTI